MVKLLVLHNVHACMVDEYFRGFLYCPTIILCSYTKKEPGNTARQILQIVSAVCMEHTLRGKWELCSKKLSVVESS